MSKACDMLLLVPCPRQAEKKAAKAGGVVKKKAKAVRVRKNSTFKVGIANNQVAHAIHSRCLYVRGALLGCCARRSLVKAARCREF